MKGIEYRIKWMGEAKHLTTENLTAFGDTVVIAPHPDDESLGCGGTIALLTEAGVNVRVIFVSDGSMSHPNSIQYPVDKRIALREDEALKALSLLGVDKTKVSFMRWPDSKVPGINEDDFELAVNALTEHFMLTEPQTVLLPWQNDPHPDHRSTWQIADEVIKISGLYPRVLQYIIWLWERGAEADLPEDGKAKWTAIDISSKLNIKKAAIQAHVSQVTNLISDDPEGFVLSEEVLSHFEHPYELFIENV